MSMPKIKQMSTKLRYWLYRKNLQNFLHREQISRLHFWLLKALLRRIENEVFFTGIIQRSARLEAQEITDISYQRKNKAGSFQQYNALFKKLRFSCKEIWIIKGSIYSIERVERLFDVELRNIATQEKLPLNRLFPLSLEDCTYHSNLAYDPPWLIQKRKQINAEGDNIKLSSRTITTPTYPFD